MATHGYMTFRDIVSSITAFAKNNSSNFTTRTEEKVRQAYRQAVDSHTWQELKKTTTSVSTTAGSANVYLPSYVESVRGVVDLTTFESLSYEAIDNIFWKETDQLNTSGYSIRFSDLGISPYQVDFYTAGEKINVASSSSSDSSVVLRLHGIDSNSVEITETITTNGTSTVTSSNTYIDLYAVSTDDTHVGIITYSGNTSSRTYGRIAAADKAAVYRKIRLASPALNSDSLAIIYKKAARDLTNDEDLPEIPVSSYLQEMGMAFALEYDENEAAASVHRQNAAQALAQAMARSTADTQDVVQSSPVFRPSMSRRLTIERPGG